MSDTETKHYDKVGNKIGESRKSSWDDSTTIHYDKAGNKIGESRKSSWDDSTTIHYDKAGNKIGESWVGVGASDGAHDGSILVILVVLGPVLLFFHLLDKFPILELGIEIFLYVCAFLYFMKRRRYKRTGNEADKPSKFLSISTKVLIVLGVAYVAFSVLSFAIAGHTSVPL